MRKMQNEISMKEGYEERKSRVKDVRLTRQQAAKAKKQDQEDERASAESGAKVFDLSQAIYILDEYFQADATPLD